VKAAAWSIRMNILSEEISSDEAKCLSLLSFNFLNYMRLMTTEKGKYFPAVEDELLELVRDEVPNVDAEYSKLQSNSQQKEFLKELLLEYLVGVFVDTYKKKNKTINDFVAGHEQSAKKYKEKEPDVVIQLKKCLRNPSTFEPTFHSGFEKEIGQAQRKVKIPAADTVAVQEKRKLTKKPSSESSLKDWFGRKGAPGKKGGWVDCNTCRKDKKTGRKKCSPCGRSGKEKRAKYPSCRPTPSACGERGKWGKKSKAGKKENLSMDLDQIIMQELSSVLDEKKKKKKKKKSSGKKDACYHKVKSRYKVWPSAYASGALVKCRKAGAKNWGNSKKESLQAMIEDELSQVLLENKGGLKHKVIKALKDEGGAAGMGALVKHTKASKADIQKIVNSSKNIKVHKDGDIILMDSLDEKDDIRDTYGAEVVDRNKKKRKKAAKTMKLSEKGKKPCKPSKGKRFAKRVDGKCRSFGQKGQAKSGGDRIRPGTKKGDAYCARSAKIKKCKNPPCANALSRKKWKCKGSKSMSEHRD